MSSASNESSEDDSSTSSGGSSDNDISTSVDMEGRLTHNQKNDKVDENDEVDSSHEDDDNEDDSSHDEEDSSQSSNDIQEIGELLERRNEKSSNKGIDMTTKRQKLQSARELALQRLALYNRESKKRKTNDDVPASTKDKSNKDSNHADKHDNNASLTTKKKKSKNAPTEVSSKKSDYLQSRRRQFDLSENGLGVDVKANLYKPRDPRMSNLSGHYSHDHFVNNYAFLDDLREEEISALKKRIAAREKKNNKAKYQNTTLEDDKAKLQVLLQQKSFVKQGQNNMEKTVKQQIKQKVAAGESKPYFLKKREIKKLTLEAKYDDLRKTGGEKAVLKAMEKRRKKNKSRDSNKIGG